MIWVRTAYCFTKHSWIDRTLLQWSWWLGRITEGFGFLREAFAVSWTETLL